MHPVRRLEEAALGQRGALIGWVPVCLAIGIGGYFALRFEPGALHWLWLALTGLAALALVPLTPYAARPLAVGVVLVASGAGLAKAQELRVAAPQLDFRYYGAIEGRVVMIDRSASDAVRLTLDRVRLDRVPPARTPERVRVSVHGDQPFTAYRAGDRLMTTGHLSPPSGPAEPGGFDFQRHAYFMGLGAVGYTRNPVLRAGAATGDWGLWLFTQRMRVSSAVQAALPGERGAFAAAILSGDRSGMGQETLEDLRASNLAHLLAISGLHMGLLTGFVFAAVRLALSLVPPLALRLPVKKIAALVAIAAGAAYLGLSGGNVATERAFIMVTVMFVAILLDRRALTLRAVAIAAIIVLVIEPIALVGPGFQMSFAATTALVATFQFLRRFELYRLPRWLRPALSVFVSSLVAGLATAPIAAAHFNQFAHFGLIANLLSVPLMGVLVMPAAVLAACLAPLGLAWIGLWIMGQGLRWILFVAHTVAGLDGALSHVVAPGPLILPLIALSGLWFLLWQGRARLAGPALGALALVLWTQTERETLLVADSGGLIGLMGDEGRALSRPTGSGFVADIWLENDGGPVPQELAAARPGLSRDGRSATATLGGFTVLQVSGKTALAALDGCGEADILISNQSIEDQRPCLVFDVKRLRDTGALGLSLEDGALRITTARALTGDRPWNRAGRNPSEPPPTRLALRQ